mmetsp:Transcript_13833/g.41063  ORF Transcript_13833/g.41063 Transcript_13833/m.41063 type:complete len:461 (-) Transcript_13833:232-1614(-)
MLKLPCDTDELLLAIAAATAAQSRTSSLAAAAEFEDAGPFGFDLTWLSEDAEDKKGDARAQAAAAAIWRDGPRLELALTGRAFELLDARRPEELLQLYPGLRIFARTSPAAKTRVVQRFMAIGLVVAMCGDGGNDCGALRTAHAGVALSEAEASLVSPFTSRTKSIRSMVDLLLEGRCALTTSFACYKFIVLAGQLISMLKVFVSYYLFIAPPMAYLSFDVLVTMTMSFALTLAKPLTRLSKNTPTNSLLGPTTMASAVGAYGIFFVFYIVLVCLMDSEHGYIQWPYKCADADDWWTLGDNWESTVIAISFICFQTHAGVLFALSGRHRLPLWRNTPHALLYVALATLWSCVLLTGPNDLTDLWHIASRNFNEEDTDSEVWQNYQKAGAGDEATRDDFPDCHGGPATDDYGMSFWFRLRMWMLIVLACVLTTAWELLVVTGPVRDAIQARVAPRKTRLRA